MKKPRILPRINGVLSNLVKPSNSLSQRVVSGGFWMFALRIVFQVFYFVRIVILARILAPHDFGLMGIALLMLSTLETFSQTGFMSALVQKKNDIEAYLNSAWTIMILRGTALFFILFIFAPHAAAFFRVMEAKLIIQAVGLSVLFKAWGNIGVIYFQKDLEFNKQFILSFLGLLIDFIVAVSAAIVLRNAWGLVLGLLAGNLASTIASYFIHPYRPTFAINVAKAKELWKFGRWVFASSVLIFLVTHGDDLFVGKVLGATVLGLYQMAYRISNLPATEITHILSQVAFPAYSMLQDDMPRLRKAYLRVFHLVAFFSFSIACLVFVLSSDITIAFLGIKWVPMIPALQVLAFEGLIRALAATAGSVFYAVGKPKLDTRWQIIRFLILSTTIYPMAAKWGIVGVSLSALISVLVSTLGLVVQVVKTLRFNSAELLKGIAIFLVGSVGAGISISFAKIYMSNSSAFLRLFSSLGLGIFVYLAIVLFLDYSFGFKVIKSIRENIAFLR